MAATMINMFIAQQPSSGLINGYLFENPWPLGILLLLVGVAIGGLALRDGRLSRLPIACLLAVLGAGVIAAGFIATTAGEHAERIAKELVAAVEGNDLTGADRLLADDMTYGATNLRNLPIGSKDDIMRAIARFAERVMLEENRITTMDIATISGDEGHARFSLWTEATGGGTGSVPIVGRSSWILVVRRTPDNEWKVQRIIWVELNGQAPPTSRM